MSSKSIYTSPLCSCIKCQKLFSAKGVHTHFITTHTVAGAAKRRLPQLPRRVDASKIKALDRRREYNTQPSTCTFCKKPLSYDRRHNKFCDHSCQMKYTIANKTKDSYLRQAKNLLITLSSKHAGKIIPEIVGEYSKLHLCTCKITGQKWFSATVKSVHPTVIDTLSQYRYQCRFNFQIKKYPAWFSYATPLIIANGWYAASNKGNNLAGYSRDHMFSVSDGFKHNIPPHIISHPANCKIMQHYENQKKHSSSEITITQLYQRIDDFNLTYGEM